jgi:hypothetical protein
VAGTCLAGEPMGSSALDVDDDRERGRRVPLGGRRNTTERKTMYRSGETSGSDIYSGMDARRVFFYDTEERSRCILMLTSRSRGKRDMRMLCIYMYVQHDTFVEREAFPEYACTTFIHRYIEGAMHAWIGGSTLYTFYSSRRIQRHVTDTDHCIRHMEYALIYASYTRHVYVP